MRPILRIMAAALFVASSACASTGGAAAPRRDARVITEAEIRGTTRANVYELVQAVRADWLRKRGSTDAVREAGVSFGAPDDVMAYMDGQRLGTAAALRSISPKDIVQIRHYDASGAQLKWGNGHPNGVIEVLTLSGARN